MTETDFYKLAKNLVRYWTWERIETSLTSGHPDCILSHGWKSHRVELKLVKGKLCYFEPSQISWANRMRTCNVHNAWVMAYEPKGQNPYLFPYRYVPELAKSKPKSKKYTLAVADVPMLYTDWETIGRALRYNYGS